MIKFQLWLQTHGLVAKPGTKEMEMEKRKWGNGNRNEEMEMGKPKPLHQLAS